MSYPKWNNAEVDNSSLRSILDLAFQESWKFKLVTAMSGILYWVVYAASSGMVFYYQSDLTPLLKSAMLPNPYFVINSRTINDLYLSGMIWYPNGHIQMNLLFGPTIFSILLAGLFALSMLLVAYTFPVPASGRRSRLGGFLAIVPALFSSGCCSVPFGVLLIGTLVPSAALSTLVYTYPLVTNIAFAVLMLFSLVYTSRKISRLCSTSKQS